ncbi:hypothetical protein [Runella aurantiaca]|uniref:Uncharacterized protein n=1 Tax=Runella aurantiaca TaxID=2282308 RepID=A0A369I979_9BACT|nr:hypothetical protein [Runella aurantiaca]RDB05047.1 hypothetical protein DVG78_15890 [Runella aurantiaca]
MQTPSNNNSNASIGNSASDLWIQDAEQPNEAANKAYDEPKNPRNVAQETKEFPEWSIIQNTHDDGQPDEAHEEFLTPSGRSFIDEA